MSNPTFGSSKLLNTT